MSKPNFGNQLNQILNRAIGDIFEIGELSQLAHFAFEHMIKFTKNHELDEIEFNYPIGLNPDGTVMLGESKYPKDDLINKYTFISVNQLGLNGIYQIVTVMESMLTDICRSVILNYPHKIGGKKSIQISTIIKSQSIEELHLYAADSLIYELSYKSPKEFSEEIASIVGVNLLEIPAFHRYIEVKATRDIYIHNQGIVNEIYISKSDSHARAGIGVLLPMNTQYFLQAYESALQIIETLEKRIHEIWPSSEHEERLAKRNA